MSCSKKQWIYSWMIKSNIKVDRRLYSQHRPNYPKYYYGQVIDLCILLNGLLAFQQIYQIIFIQMDEDLKRGLLSKKNNNFQKMFQEGLVKIQRIKQKNDLMQKQIGSDIEDSLKAEINKQKDFVEKEIGELKNLIQQIESKYRDPESKNKLKQLKVDAQKQIERNKIILKDVINRSFIGKSGGRTNPEGEDQENYMEGGAIDYNNLGGNREKGIKRSSLITEEQVQIDYEIQRKIMLQKTDMINQVEQSANRINELMNDMGMMVEEQGQNLNAISDQLIKANHNVVAANENLQDANQLQKKARKKYICLVTLLLLIILIVAGIIFFLTS